MVVVVAVHDLPDRARDNVESRAATVTQPSTSAHAPNAFRSTQQMFTWVFHIIMLYNAVYRTSTLVV